MKFSAVALISTLLPSASFHSMLLSGVVFSSKGIGLGVRASDPTPLLHIDFDQPNDMTSNTHTYNTYQGADIQTRMGDDFQSLRIDQPAEYAYVSDFGIGPNQMGVECTLTIWINLERSGAGNGGLTGWVLNQEIYGGWNRGIVMEDSRFFGGIGIPANPNWTPWNNPKPITPINEWIHVAAVYRQSPGKSYLFVDGVRSDNFVQGTLIDGTPNLYIGSTNFGENWSDAWIREVRVYNTALTNDQVVSLSQQMGIATTLSPSVSPSKSPSLSPSETPSLSPSESPSLSPSESPSLIPTTSSSSSPSVLLTEPPSFTPGDPLMWYINRLSNGPINGATTATLEMIVYYNISHHDFSFEVFGPTCDNTVPATGLIVSGTTSNSSNADGFTNVAVTLSLNQTEVESNGGIWSGDNIGGEINFCLSAFLWLDNSRNITTGEIVTFDETRFIIKVDKTTNFTLEEIVLSRENASFATSRDIDYEANLVTYQCDSSLNKVVNPPPLSQKDNVLSFCVNSNSNIQVNRLESLVLYQDTKDGFPEHKYAAIVDGVPTKLVAQSTPEKNVDGYKVVRVQVVLDAMFFANPFPASVKASGLVALDVAGATNRRRRLPLNIESSSASSINKNIKNIHGNGKDKKEERLLQEGGFSLNVSLKGGDDYAAIDSSSISENMSFVLTTIGGLVLATMILL